MFKTYDIKPENVAKLISENNIVTIFQGRSRQDHVLWVIDQFYTILQTLMVKIL